MSIYLSYAVMYSAVLFGISSLGIFALFLFAGPLSLFELGLSDSGVLWFDATLSLLFFVQHSLMVRQSFRRKTSKFISSEFDKAFYALASGAVLLCVVILWQESTWYIAKITGIYEYLLRLLYFLSIAGVLWASVAFRLFDPFGRKNILNHLKDRKPEQTPFVAHGPYRFVRHPLYFFVLIMIWTYPDLTADRLLFNCAWTIWIVIGTVLEERDLVDEFGGRYQEYQKKTPMLIPYRIPIKYARN